MPEDCESYDQYISRIINRLKKDLIREYPDADYEEDDAFWTFADQMVNSVNVWKLTVTEWSCKEH